MGLSFFCAAEVLGSADEASQSVAKVPVVCPKVQRLHHQLNYGTNLTAHHGLAREGRYVDGLMPTSVQDPGQDMSVMISELWTAACMLTCDKYQSQRPQSRFIKQHYPEPFLNHVS